MRKSRWNLESCRTVVLLEELLQKHETLQKQKDMEIRSLDMQVHKLQSSLDSTAKTNEQMKESIDSKNTKIRTLDAQVQKLQSITESMLNDNNQLKSDLKAANKIALDAEKMISKLEGKLEVYSLKEIDKPMKTSK